MPPEEEKRQEQFLLLLLALAGTTEGRINRAVRPALVQTMLRVRRAVQTLSPTGQFRNYEWARIAPKILPILETIPKTMLPQLLREVQMMLPSVQEAAAEFANPGDPEPVDVIPQTQQQLLAVLGVAGASSLSSLMGRPSINRYTLQMAKELDMLVRSMIMADATTQEISDKILKLTTVNGRPAGQIKTGSFANKMWNRVQNTSAAVVWDGVSKTVTQVLIDQPAKEWVWNAVLDPETCPVCRPLDGQRREKPSQFDRLPPLHPRCRCAVLPLFG